MKCIEYQIRRATPSDAGDIAAAHADSIRSIGPNFYNADTVDAWGSGLTSDIYLQAMEGGELFWIAVGTLAGKQAVLGFSSDRVDEHEHGISVYVRGDAARQGIGSALFQVGEDDARRAGARSIDVAASLAAVAFYKARGFEEVGRGEHRLQSGQPMPCVFMRKPLTLGETKGRRTTR
jgi:ribosomal protein S18 acetylase RimI-like enzyme